MPATTPDEAPLFKRWLSWASRCRLEPFKRLGRTITKHLPGVLNGFQAGKHNAPSGHESGASGGETAPAAIAASKTSSPWPTSSLENLPICPPLPSPVSSPFHTERTKPLLSRGLAIDRQSRPDPQSSLCTAIGRLDTLRRQGVQGHTADQLFRATSTSSSIFFASPNSMRLLSL
ncbi:MAG: transposase [Candidatus Accumulibacter sp.]|uniref:Transposase n=1 Tax=Candidatus Accumulibacter proximus TaxID=2954385 RepID=A0A935Q230_9PROT|nr:transposase [Candidatus Accumulibacter proximus]